MQIAARPPPAKSNRSARRIASHIVGANSVDLVENLNNVAQSEAGASGNVLPKEWKIGAEMSELVELPNESFRRIESEHIIIASPSISGFNCALDSIENAKRRKKVETEERETLLRSMLTAN